MFEDQHVQVRKSVLTDKVRDVHLKIRGEMCKFVQSCPLLWEEERDQVLPILFSLLGDKSAEVRREAMHAVSEIFHVRAT